MPLIVVGSAKGAPGGSTTALALSAAWPGEKRPVVVEADGAGGDVMLRAGLLEAPSLVSLAAAARGSGLSEKVLRQHVQRLPVRVPVVVAPAAGEQSTAALATLETLWREADFGSDIVLADVGRIGQVLGPVGELVSAADVVVMVTGGTAEDLAHTEAVLARLRPRARHLVVAVVGWCGWSANEVAQVLGAEVCHMLPYDVVSARMLRGIQPERRRLRRRQRYPLMDAARLLAAELGAFFPERAVAETESASSPGPAGLAAILGGERP